MNTAEMTDTAKITWFPMGSGIPEWLLSADPQVAGAPRGAWRFDVDVQVIEMSNDFLVFPVIPLGAMTSASILDFSGMTEHFVYATSKPVRVIHQVNHILPIEYRPQVEKQRAAMDMASQTPAPPVQLMPPRPGLLRRIWRALF